MVFSLKGIVGGIFGRFQSVGLGWVGFSVLSGVSFYD